MTVVPKKPTGDIAELLAIMRRLRDKDGGCPWDLEQSFATIAPYTIEEAYEVASAIEAQDYAHLKDELGDLLLQVVFHAQMASEEGRFDFTEVVRAICEKMIRRHPHVFGDGSARTPSAVTERWEEIKRAEREAKPAKPQGLLDDVPRALPALMRAVKLQNRAAQVGFDWPSAVTVTDKIAEESRELAEAHASGKSAKVAEEFGDLLFAMANLSRHLKVDPEEALRVANAKFVRRFKAIESSLQAQGRTLEDASLEEMEALWQEAKKAEN
ncbi:MAG TPA: nucleoside triphosphate pyrophosphohydrolase [Micropepsaceae bacterium]|nr:nucleoside triphosphate pyrophosphohydrolase [Micropepsaceae bacterium]